MPAPSSQLVSATEAWEVDTVRRELRARDGSSVPIGGRAFDILEVLVRSAGDLVTKDDLMSRVWPGAIVEENTLQVHISAVRKSLGPSRGLLKTISGRGYRLLGTWTISPRHPEAPQGAAPPPPASPTLSSNLPAPGTKLIGRTAAVQQLQDLLSAYRAVTLTGPGGIGKTKLAVEVARNLLSSRFGDVWLVELASLANPDLVPSAVASALGLKLGVSEISPETVARTIGERKLLLVLDNCEHVIDAAARFADTAVRLCQNLTVLATSREVLRIDGEFVYRVPPLDVPPLQQDEPTHLLGHSAVQLLIARMSALNSDISLHQPNLLAIAGICRRLDGIPLAIEFAAARAVTLGLAQVATHLDDRFSLLTGGRRTALRRQQTLRATLDWSYELLAEEERCLLRHLGVFSAGFTLEAAAAVMAGARYPKSVVVEGVANLVAKSLVTLDGSEPTSRWRLLETIRAYAIEKLVEHDESERALRTHAGFYRDLVTPAPGVSAWEPTAESLARYGREMDNVRAALDWAFSPVGDASIGIALTALYMPVWMHFVLMVECRQRIEQALSQLGPQSDDTAPMRVLLDIGLGITLIHTGGDATVAIEVLSAGLTTAEMLGDKISQMYALWAIWACHAYRGNHRVAEPAAEAFLGLAIQSGDPARLYLADRQMGTTLHYRGDQPRARDHLDRVAELYRQSQSRPYTAWFGISLSDFSQATLARVLCVQGLPDQARSLAKTCVERSEFARQKLGLCFALAEAACPLALMTGDLAAADRMVAQLIAAAKDLNLTYWTSFAQCLDGVLRIKRGDFAAGVATLRAALTTSDREGGTARYSAYLSSIAEGLAGLHQWAEAKAVLDQALARAERDGDGWYLAELIRLRGEFALRGGDDGSQLDAEQCFRDALAVARRQRALFWELQAALSLARLLLTQERPDAARDALTAVYARFTEGFEIVSLRAARTMLDSLPPRRI